jgi:hypothetical protein
VSVLTTNIYDSMHVAFPQLGREDVGYKQGSRNISSVPAKKRVAICMECENSARALTAALGSTHDEQTNDWRNGEPRYRRSLHGFAGVRVCSSTETTRARCRLTMLPGASPAPRPPSTPPPLPVTRPRTAPTGPPLHASARTAWNATQRIRLAGDDTSLLTRIDFLTGYNL